MKNLNFLIKPASSLCNLCCRYCFYKDEAANRSSASMGIMSEETVELLIHEAFISIDPTGVISFAFQGGEPTLAGLDYFRHFVETAEMKKPAGVQISYSIQTNGTLFDEEWAEFFRNNNFLVGISVDGFKDLHNLHRNDAEGKDTWNRVSCSIALLMKKQVRVNALCVVTGQCVRSPHKAYLNLKTMGFEYLQFIACLDPIGQERGKMPWSLKPEAYGKFLCQLFDLWYKDWLAGQYCSIRLFDDYVHLLLNEPGSTCATCGNCGAYYVIEADGSLYPCDFYVLDQWKIGMLGEQTLAEIASGEAMQRFLLWGKDKPVECLTCRWRKLCNGGCKNDWILVNNKPHNYYCQSFQTFFSYAEKRLIEITRAELSLRSRHYPSHYHK